MNNEQASFKENADATQISEKPLYPFRGTRPPVIEYQVMTKAQISEAVARAGDSKPVPHLQFPGRFDPEI